MTGRSLLQILTDADHRPTGRDDEFDAVVLLPLVVPLVVVHEGDVAGVGVGDVGAVLDVERAVAGVADAECSGGACEHGAGAGDGCGADTVADATARPIFIVGTQVADAVGDGACVFDVERAVPIKIASRRGWSRTARPTANRYADKSSGQVQGQRRVRGGQGHAV